MCAIAADDCVPQVASGRGRRPAIRGPPPVLPSMSTTTRARVSHICGLQVNLAAGAMTIDFGGLDRWDYSERARNLEEAVRPVT